MSKSSTTIKRVATPNRVTTHPGEVLNAEFLKPLGMSVNALALALRVPATPHRRDCQGRAVSHSGYGVAPRTLLRHERRILDEHAGYA